MRTHEGPYDVLIIGGGPAGLTAAVYAARLALSTAVVAGEVGGQAQWASKVENYLGFQLIAGSELVRQFREHVRRFPVDCYEGEYVNAVVPSGDLFEVFTQEGTSLQARAVIIASGRAAARLAVPGEKELVGRGVSFCATCDGAFFRGHPVAVVGPGEAAAEAALQLSRLECQVTLVSQRPLRAPEELLRKLEADPRIEQHIGWNVVAIEGADTVEAVLLRDAAQTEERRAVAAVFIERGFIPPDEFTGGIVQTNERGEIVVARDNMTSQPGIFAAGDVTDDYGKQIIIAAGEGARASMAAASWLRRRDVA